jgi:hypothetical protein
VGNGPKMYQWSKDGVRAVMVAILIAASMTAVNIGFAHAKVKIIGAGETMSLDPAAIPAELKPNWVLMEEKCTKCHGLDRTLMMLQSGIAPSGAVLDKRSIQVYAVRMLKKTDSGINGPELKKIIDLLDWLFDEAAR